MKKRIISLIAAAASVLALTAALASCGGDSNTGTETTAGGSSSTETKKIEIAVPERYYSNEARALQLLEQEGIIKLREGAGITATVSDIIENPKNITFREVEAAQLPEHPP